jgi:hypothetical protein
MDVQFEKKCGQLITPDGSIYQGTFNKAGKPHGNGVLTYLNGDVYSGSFKEGKPHGSAVNLVLYAPKGDTPGDVFFGQFQAGEPVSGTLCTTDHLRWGSSGTFITREHMGGNLVDVLARTTTAGACALRVHAPWVAQQWGFGAGAGWG